MFLNGKKGSIVEAFYGIRWGHHIAGFNSPTDHPTVQMTFEGAQRICSKPVRKKDPMMAEMIKGLIDNIHASEQLTLHNWRFLIVIAVCYAGFLRIDELLATKLGDIKN